VLELAVPGAGALVRFQYRLPQNAARLLGVAPLTAGNLPLPDGERLIGMLSLEALDRKVHLATLPVVFTRARQTRQDFYEVDEPLCEGRMIIGCYLDEQPPSPETASYRLKIIFKTLDNT
jgi:hypothetical protein